MYYIVGFICQADGLANTEGETMSLTYKVIAGLSGLPFYQ